MSKSIKPNFSLIYIENTSNTSIFGAYCPIGWKNYQGPFEITEGRCHVYYFENEKMRICRSKEIGSEFIHSS